MKQYGCPAAFWPCFPSAAALKGGSAASEKQGLQDFFPGAVTAPLILATAEFISPGMYLVCVLCL